MPCDAVFFLDHLAAETDEIGTLAAIKFPRIAVRQPSFGQLDLPAIVDTLAEHAVHIADAIAVSRDVQTGEALHKARREAPEAAIAQRRVGLQILDLGEVDAEFAQRRLHLVGQPHVRQRIAQQAPDQEFQAEVIDPLAAGIIGAPG